MQKIQHKKMKLKTKQTIFRILSNHRLWFGVWTAVAVLGVVTRISKGGAFNFNNFRIFRSVFWHTVHKSPLYAEYPAEHFDVNHYGVLFSALIAPFAVLPVLPGVLLWMLANVWMLFYAVRQLNIAPVYRGVIYFLPSTSCLWLFPCSNSTSGSRQFWCWRMQ